jgi:hypothetical protein
VTVRRGQDWGEPGSLAPEDPVAADDRELVALATSARPPALVGLVGGDLHRTLGAPHREAEDLRRDGGTRLVVDLGTARLTRPGGGIDVVVFAAHLVVRTGRGPRFLHHTFVAMNAAFTGPDNLGPRAHPGDGVLDLVEGQLGRWDLLRSGRRRRSGTHVPHPGLTERRGRGAVRSFPGGARVSADGRDAGLAVEVEVEVLPEAIAVLI